MARIREAATKDGLPRKAYAYAPEADPATWKLPIYTAAGAVDEDRLPGAVASLSPGGFRGQKADIPAADLPMVKAKLRTAYRKWKGSEVEYPDTISEADYSGICYSCNHPIACDEDDGCACPNHVPEALGDVAAALDALEDLYALYASEVAPDEPPEQAQYLQTAIDAVLKFIPSEGAELRKPAGMAEALAVIEEAGKRNNASDQKLIQQMHDHTHTLGAQHEPGKAYAGMGVPVREAIAATGEKAEVAFAESSAEGTAFVTLSEAGAVFDDATRTVTITPIKPGFGNKRDHFYYPTETLREATTAGLFDGLKMFRNHPRKSDEKELPERDVKDWFATSRKAVWSESAQAPRVDVVVHDEGDYRRWKEAPEQIAFSIKGGGYARPGTVNGQDARIVESLAKVRSIDWVTEAGAGGAIALAESAAEEFDMDIKTLSTEQLREELRLREADGDPKPEGEVTTEPTPEAEPEKPKDEAKPPEAASPAASGGEGPAAAPDGYVSREEFEALKASLSGREIKESAQKAVAAEMASSTLPRAAKDVVAAKFAEAGWGNGFTYTDEPALRTAVKGELAAAAKLLAAVGKPVSPVKGLGGAADGDESIRESVRERLDARWGKEAMPTPAATVIRAEDMGKPDIKVVEQDSGDDGAPTSDLSEAAVKVQGNIAAKFGI